MKNNLKEKIKVIAVVGTTASGKTARSIELAQILNGEIISADSMAIYKYMDIGTAKPDKFERGIVPHHMIDVVEPTESYSAADYVEGARKAIEDVSGRNKTPIITGGTGLYIDALLRGNDFQFRAVEGSTDEIRRELYKQAEENGGEYLKNKLMSIDSETAKKLHVNDIKRIVRALEIYELTGKPMSELSEQPKEEPPYDVIYYGLTYPDRNLLYKKIDERVDKMMESGMLNEVMTLIAMGVNLNHTSMQAIGYKELYKSVMGEYGIDEAVEIIKMNSRRYAKRQLTWFRRNKDIQWLDAEQCQQGIISKIVI